MSAATSHDRPPWAALWIVVMAAVVARLAAALILGNDFHFADETDYVDCVRRLFAGQGFGERFEQAPGYPVLLGILALPVAPDVWWLRLAQAVVTGLGCLLVGSLAASAFGSTAAVVAALLYALDPLMVVTGALLYPETSAALIFVVVVMLAANGAREDRTSASLGVGLALGVLAQLRPVALAAAPFLALWVAVVVGSALPRRAVHVAAMVLGCVLALAPWTIRNYLVHGAITPLQTAGTQVVARPSEGREGRGLTSSIVASATQEPARFGERVAREFAHFWELYPQRLASDQATEREKMSAADPRMPTEQTFRPSLRNTVSAISFGVELLLALGGVVLAWRHDRRTTSLLLGTTLSFAFGYTLFVAKMRYRIPVLPFVYVFAGVGGAALLEALRGRTAST